VRFKILYHPFDSKDDDNLDMSDTSGNFIVGFQVPLKAPLLTFAKYGFVELDCSDVQVVVLHCSDVQV
jgi:hypothetical protein